MKLKFKSDLKSDIWNWQEVLNSKGSYGQNWLKKWPKDITQKEAKDKEKLKAYLSRKYYKNGAVKKYVDWLNVAVDPKKIEKPLENITGKKIPFKEVYVVVTTIDRCPYDFSGGGFFVYYAASLSWIYVTAMHECMHFIIHKNYWQKMLDAGLSDSQAHDIKEALTVLLDSDYKKLGGKAEGGYPNHQNIRKDIKKLANQSRSFDSVIKKTINLYLKKYMKKCS